MAKQWTPQDILSISGSYWDCCALQAAVQLDVFTALSNGPKTTQELAVELACDERAFGMLATALVALGFLERNGATLSAPDSVLAVLSRNSPDYLGFIIQHHAHIMPGWARLATAVRSGASTADESTRFTDNVEKRRDFLMGMFNIARLQAQTVADALDLSHCRSMIDVGGGPGTYAVFFCLKNPQLQATVFDLPTSEPFAREVIARYKLTDRIDFAGGHFLHDKLPGSYDMAWLSQVLHGESPEDAALLVQNAARTLRPGGLLCIQEFMLDDDLSGPPRSALFNLNMLVQTKGGQAYTKGAIKRILIDAGAKDVTSLDIELPGNSRISVGRLP